MLKYILITTFIIFYTTSQNYKRIKIKFLTQNFHWKNLMGIEKLSKDVHGEH